MSSLSKRSSFLELHRARKRSLAKLAEYRQSVRAEKERIADIEAYQQKRSVAMSTPLETALAAEKRAEVVRMAAIAADSDDAWVWEPREPPYSYCDCSGEECWYACNPDRWGEFKGAYRCVFDQTADVQFCEVCFRHDAHRAKMPQKHAAREKRNYLERKAHYLPKTE